MITHYEVLGISKDATQEEIKKAYRANTRVTHPDRNDGRGAGLFDLTEKAWQVLGDEKKRAAYDRELSKQGTHSSGSSSSSNRTAPQSHTSAQDSGKKPGQDSGSTDSNYDSEGTSYDEPHAFYYDPITPSQMDWWNSDHVNRDSDDEQITLYPLPLSKKGIWIGLAIWAFFGLAFFLFENLYSVDEGLSLSTVEWIAYGVILVSPLIAHLIGARWSWRLIPLGTLGNTVSILWLGLAGLVFYHTDTGTAWYIGVASLVLLAAAYVGAHLVGRQALLFRQRKQEASTLWFSDQEARYRTVGATPAGEQVEQVAQRTMLESVGRLFHYMHGVRVICKLKAPSGIVPIAIVYGNKVVLLGVEVFAQGGEYSWSPNKDIIHSRNGEVVSVSEIAFGRAAQQIASELASKSIEVAIALAIYTQDQQGRIVDASSASAPQIGSPADVINSVGSWFSKSEQKAIVNRKVLGEVWRHVTHF